MYVWRFRRTLIYVRLPLRTICLSIFVIYTCAVRTQQVLVSLFHQVLLITIGFNVSFPVN